MHTWLFRVPLIFSCTGRDPVSHTRRAPPSLTFQNFPGLLPKRSMDAELSQGSLSVAICCFQFGEFRGSLYTPPRIGCRILEASPNSFEGLTQKPVHFTFCDQCGACSVGIGVPGTEDFPCENLEPEHPKSKLLGTIITETRSGLGWGQSINVIALVVGVVNVHGAATKKEAGMTCFHCLK